MDDLSNRLMPLVRAYTIPATQIARNLSGKALDYCKIQNPIARGVVSGFAVYLGVAGVPTLPFSFALVVCRTIKYHYDKADLLEYSWSTAAKDLFLPVLLPPVLILRWMYGMQKTPSAPSQLELSAVKARTSKLKDDWQTVLVNLKSASLEDIATTKATISANRAWWDDLGKDRFTTIQVLAALFPEKLAEWKTQFNDNSDQISHDLRWSNLGPYNGSTDNEAIYYGFNDAAAQDAEIYSKLQDNNPRKLGAEKRLINLALTLESLVRGFPNNLEGDLAPLRTAIEIVNARRQIEDEIITNALKDDASPEAIARLGEIEEWKRINPPVVDPNSNIVMDRLGDLLRKPGSEALAHTIAASKDPASHGLLNDLTANQLATRNANGDTLLRVMVANRYPLAGLRYLKDIDPLAHNKAREPSLLTLAISADVTFNAQLITDYFADEQARTRYVSDSFPQIAANLNEQVANLEKINPVYPSRPRPLMSPHTPKELEFHSNVWNQLQNLEGLVPKGLKKLPPKLSAIETKQALDEAWQASAWGGPSLD